MDAASSRTDAIRTAVANQMRIHRTINRMSQDELAERAGISRRTIQRLEKGDIAMDIKHMQGIASAFGIHWLEFMKRVNDDIEGDGHPNSNST
ncbi:helix-turn-helix domain-containing protein [Rhodococcus zopfii]|uniref:helix-turn-helix domain-containing protein n=1 Tax=Rhodococcus zopfii TaxID=43772 RepID=UPI0009F9B4A9|nr:helix-turn-helix transcriptional regulator [Rhodococcus zopfii]